MTKKINISEHVFHCPVTSEARLAVVADLHNRRGAEVADTVLSLSPDAVLLLGDLFETPPRRRYYAYDEAIAFLEAVAPVLPVFYSPGNHDYTHPAAVKEKLASLGVTTLVNRDCEWRGIRIGGIPSYQFDGKAPQGTFLRDFAEKDGYKLLLCHHPEYYPKHIRPLDIDLIVSGHAHGGQWRFFGRGVFSPGQGILPRYTSGLYEGRLLVSRGVKPNVGIPRILNARHIPVIRLVPEGKAES